MAVITYKVSVAGGQVTLDPGLDQVKLAKGDFLIFAPDASVKGDIFVQFTGGAKIFVAAAPLSGVMQFERPVIDPDGNITFVFQDPGGDSGEGGGFPP